MTNSSNENACEIAQLQKKIETYEAWFRAIDEYADFDVWFKDAESTYRFVNKKFEKALGKPRQELLGKKPKDVFPDPSRRDRVLKLDQKIMSEGLLKRVVPCDGSGKLEMHEEHRFVVKDVVGDPIGLGCFAFEVTEKSLVEEALAKAEQLAKMGSWRWSVRDSSLISCSENLANMLGIDMPSAFSLMSNRLENLIIQEDRERIGPKIKEIAEGTVGAYEMEFRILNAHNQIIYIREIAEPLFNSNGKTSEYTVTWQDISQQKNTENELLLANELLENRVAQRTTDLRYLADHDQLTGLLNRYAFINKILDELPQLSERSELIIFVIDLDGFKGINDCFGHFIGDELLKTIAKRFSSFVDGKGLVARLGGDEFGLAIPVHRDANVEAHAIYQEVKVLIKHTIHIENLQLHIGLSSGFSIAHRDKKSIANAMKFADIALYRSKESKSGKAVAYEEHMAKEIEFRKRLELDLVKAISAGEIYPVYQPQRCIATGALRGVEVLARWEHPVLGNIEPEIFIRAAEECGMINKLGNLILRRGCKEMSTLMNTYGQKFKVSVNLSSAQFYNRDLLPSIETALRDSQLPASMLELEITETLFLRNTNRTQFLLRKMREAGIKIALDDFGTGYSSLSYLQKFKVDTIKLDQSFIKNISNDKASKNIAEGIIALAHSLELDVVAEGVEQEIHMDVLKAQRCNFAQGFLFGKPMSAKEFSALFQDERAHSTSEARPFELETSKLQQAC